MFSQTNNMKNYPACGISPQDEEFPTFWIRKKISMCKERARMDWSWIGEDDEIRNLRFHELVSLRGVYGNDHQCRPCPCLPLMVVFFRTNLLMDLSRSNSSSPSCEKEEVTNLDR